MLDQKHIIDIFGKPHSFEESMLRLSIVKPKFTAKDFNNILKEVTKNYLRFADSIKDEHKENPWSTKILNKLHMMLESSELSIDTKKLNKMLQLMKKQVAERLKQKPRSQRLGDIYEFVCEFEEQTK